MTDHIWDKNIVQNMQLENDALKALLKEVLADICEFNNISNDLYVRCEAACTTGGTNAR